LILAFVYWQARKANGRYAWPAFGSLVIGSISAVCCVVPLPALTGLSASAAFCAANFCNASPGPIVGNCIVVTMLFYGGCIAMNVVEYQELNKAFPVEAPGGRLPNEKRYADQRRDFDQGDIEPGLDETSFVHSRLDTQSYLRSALLRRLHERTLAEFVVSEGLGVGRMYAWNRHVIKLAEGDVLPFAEQKNNQGAESGSERHHRSVSAPERKRFGDLNLDSILDFVNAKGFGYVIDRETCPRLPVPSLS